MVELTHVFMPFLHSTNRAHHSHKPAWFDHQGWVSDIARAYPQTCSTERDWPGRNHQQFKKQQMKIVTAAIIHNEGKYFIARRGPSEKLSGYWEFPGGKVEDGESLSDCLRRELKEELGISAKIGDVLTTSDYVYEHGHIRLVAMAAEIVSGKLDLTVHDQSGWLSPFEILKLNLAPADVPVAEFLLATNSKNQI